MGYLKKNRDFHCNEVIALFGGGGLHLNLFLPMSWPFTVVRLAQFFASNPTLSSILPTSK
jgi:hypothetical protein